MRVFQTLKISYQMKIVKYKIGKKLALWQGKMKGIIVKETAFIYLEVKRKSKQPEMAKGAKVHQKYASCSMTKIRMSFKGKEIIKLSPQTQIP